MFSKGIPCSDGVEATLRLYHLGDCETMEEYCQKLGLVGARYCGDAGACPELIEMGLLEP